MKVSLSLLPTLLTSLLYIRYAAAQLNPASTTSASSLVTSTTPAVTDPSASLTASESTVSTTPSASDSSTLDSSAPSTASSLAPTPSEVSSSASLSSVSSASTSLVSVSATSSATPTSSSPPLNPTLAAEINTIRTRRISAIIAAITNANSIAAWLSTLSTDGKWPDNEVNYTTGCDAQRANWPAATHWSRILTMTAAYHGGISSSFDAQWTNNTSLGSAISSAMDWWFSRDFTNDACLDGGGTSTCPCGTAGLWNTNWYSNVILVPNLVAQACEVKNTTLTITQASNCSHITTRGYSPFYRASPPGFVSGANILDMSKIGIDQALRVANETLLSEAYGRIHNEMIVEPSIAIVADGIKPDGSFGQHLGLSYAGNYGKDFSNAVLLLEEAALGTRFSAGSSPRAAFATLIDGDRWAIYRNILTGVLHWDFSVLPRFISFPVIDNQATASIKLNLSQILHVGQEWGSDTLVQFSNTLNEDTPDANAGNLVGNRMFFSNDYMVHRGEKYVSTLKMYSTRTINTEWTNNQNPYGFHLADGTLYTYLRGSEYEDIAAAWDWNLIPGITTDYQNTVLSGSTAKVTGIESFVGGASTGSIGVSAFRYTNPRTKAFSFQKAYFFLEDDVQHIMVANISSQSSAPVYSVLDQKRRNGPVYINGQVATANASDAVQTLWHDRVGYSFDGSGFHVAFQTGNKTGAWSSIGTSTQPPTTVDLFAAWIAHDDLSAPVAYTAFPATDQDEFEVKRLWARVRTVQNDAHISAVQDDLHKTTAAVFWDRNGGTVTVDHASYWDGSITITASANAVVIYRADAGTLTVSDPSQTLSMLQVTLSLSPAARPPSWGTTESKVFTFFLPPGPGGFAGSSVTQSVA